MFDNDLVIIRAEGSDAKVEAIADVANLDGKIAIGDAKTVPPASTPTRRWPLVGLYTGTEGDDGEYAPRLPTRSRWPIRSAPLPPTCPRTICVAGFVYSSDIYRYDGIEEAFVCARRFSHKPIVYPGAAAESSEAYRRGQGVHRLLPFQQEGPEDLGEVRL